MKQPELNIISFDPAKAPAYMQEVWIRKEEEKGKDPEFFKTYMKAIPRRGDILFDPDVKKHLSISSIQWFQHDLNNWVCIINLERKQK
jgi:hypothetical protein